MFPLSSATTRQAAVKNKVSDISLEAVTSGCLPFALRLLKPTAGERHHRNYLSTCRPSERRREKEKATKERRTQPWLGDSTRRYVEHGIESVYPAQYQ